MDGELELGMRVRARELVEPVEHRREKEPGQEQRGDEMLDVAVERVQGRERQRHPAHEQDEQPSKRQRKPHGPPRARQEHQGENHDHAEHHDEGDELCSHDGERNELARETHLPDEIRVLDQAS